MDVTLSDLCEFLHLQIKFNNDIRLHSLHFQRDLEQIGKCLILFFFIYCPFVEKQMEYDLRK